MLVDEFFSVCTRSKLKVNAGKRKVIVFDRREGEVVDFSTCYWVEECLWSKDG